MRSSGLKANLFSVFPEATEGESSGLAAAAGRGEGRAGGAEGTRGKHRQVCTPSCSYSSHRASIFF